MLDRRQIEEFLLRTELFQRMSAADIEVCAAAATFCRFETGEMLFARGEPGDRLFIIVSGQVRLSLVSEDGRELSVRIAGGGELLGELSTLDGAERSADAVALKPVSALALARRDILRLMAAMPDLVQRIIVFLCRRLRDTTDQLEAIALHTVEERLARLFLAELGSIGGSPSTSRLLALNQSELAQLIGASRPKVSMALAVLESEGAIRRDRGIAGMNTAVLRRMAGLPDA